MSSERPQRLFITYLDLDLSDEDLEPWRRSRPTRHAADAASLDAPASSRAGTDAGADREGPQTAETEQDEEWVSMDVNRHPNHDRAMIAALMLCRIGVMMRHLL
jgi:hypothetical protein